MKKFLYLTLLGSMLSCSGSDNNSQIQNPIPVPPVTNLSGRWNLSKKIIDGQTLNASYCETQYNYYQFAADGGAVFGQYHMYSVGGTNYCEQQTLEGVYALTGAVLTYTQGSNVVKYNVISANSLTINLQMFYYQNADGNTIIPVNDRIMEICNKAG